VYHSLSGGIIEVHLLSSDLELIRLYVCLSSVLKCVLRKVFE
jgi:hypothetical protein